MLPSLRIISDSKNNLLLFAVYKEHTLLFLYKHVNTAKLDWVQENSSIPDWIEMSDIGLLNEKPLHAYLKLWYAQPADQFEVQVDGSVIDNVQDDLLLEIQTCNLGLIVG